MRTISNAKNDFTTRGNTNGVYNNMEHEVRANARATFNREPWYLTVNKNLKNGVKV